MSNAKTTRAADADAAADAEATANAKDTLINRTVDAKLMLQEYTQRVINLQESISPTYGDDGSPALGELRIAAGAKRFTDITCLRADARAAYNATAALMGTISAAGYTDRKK